MSLKYIKMNNNNLVRISENFHARIGRLESTFLGPRFDRRRLDITDTGFIADSLDRVIYNIITCFNYDAPVKAYRFDTCDSIYSYLGGFYIINDLKTLSQDQKNNLLVTGGISSYWLVQVVDAFSIYHVPITKVQLQSWFCRLL